MKKTRIYLVVAFVIISLVGCTINTPTGKKMTIGAQKSGGASVKTLEPVWMPDGLMPNEKNGSIEIGEKPSFESTLKLNSAWTGVAWISEGDWTKEVKVSPAVTGITFEAKAEAKGIYKFAYELAGKDSAAEEMLNLGTDYKKYTIEYPAPANFVKIPLMFFLDGNSPGKTISVKNTEFIMAE